MTAAANSSASPLAVDVPRRGQALSNALSLYGSTIVTSLLGFAYWATAARISDAADVGTAGAAVATMQLVGTLATLGLGSLIIADAGRTRSGSPFAAAALRVTAGAGLAAGLAVSLVTHPLQHGGATGGLETLLFAAGCALTSFTMVLDLALIGHRRGRRQLARNVVFAASKLALLPVIAAVGTLGAASLYGAWMLGNAASVVVVLALSSDRRRWFTRSPHALRGRQWDALGHHVLNVADHCAQLALHLLVSGVLGATVNAGFYVALLIAGFCWIVPAHFGTALFAVAAGDRATLRSELRIALVTALVTGVAGTAGAAVAGRPVLAAFGPEYEDAWPALVWLVATTLPFAVRVYFGAVCRVDGRLRRGAVVTTLGALANLGVAAATVSSGISTMAAALFVIGVVQSALLWPEVARAAQLPGRRALGGGSG